LSKDKVGFSTTPSSLTASANWTSTPATVTSCLLSLSDSLVTKALDLETETKTEAPGLETEAEAEAVASETEAKTEAAYPETKAEAQGSSHYSQYANVTLTQITNTLDV